MEADFSDNGADYEEGEEAPTPSDGGATPVQDERDFGSDSEGDQPEEQPYKRSAPGPGSESGDEDGEDRDDADDGDDVGQALSRSHSDEGERSDDGERYDEGERESVDGERDSPEADRDSAEEAEEPENEEREEGERTDSESEGERAAPPPRPYEGAGRKEEAAGDSDHESRSSAEEVARQQRDARSDEEEDDARDDEEEEEQAAASAKRKADVDSEDEEGEVDKSPAAKRSRVVSDNEEEDSDREFEPKRPEPAADSGSGSDDDAPRSSPPAAKRSRLISDDEDDEAEPAETRNVDGPPEADRDGDDSGVEEGGAAIAAEAAEAAAAAPAKRRRGSDSESDADDDDGAGGGGGRGEETEGKPAARRARVVSDSEDDADAERKEEGERRAKQEAPARKAIVSDSEDDDDDAGERRRGNEPPAKKAILSDSEDEDERQAESEVPARKPKAVDSDSESGSDDAAKRNDEKTKTKEKQIFGSDSDSADEAGVGILIADIFGDSDNEEEEFTGFGQEELEKETSALGKDPAGDKDKESEYDSDEGVRGGNDAAFISDFDMMLKRKRELNRRQRRGNRDGGTFISDVDDLISAMIMRMNEAAEEDKKLNTERKPALKKMVMLPTVIKHLRKQDLVESFIDSGILSSIRDWLCPLPDKSLPNLKIREELLKVLQDLPSVPQETLKSSGIGRSVMYLYKHPKETRQNKDLAGKLINEWSRPIFGLTSNYKGMSREEREQRDLEQMPHRRRLSSGGQTPRRDLDKVLTGEEKALRPGDPGFCSRARVPMPSNRDYVIRPKWNVEVESNRGSVKKAINRVEKQMKKFADKRRSTKGIRAVKISVEGNHMPL